jgi:hypothetical protein
MPERSTDPILFLDTETTRLRRPYLPLGRRIWETGGIREEPDGTEHPLHMFTRIDDLRLPDLLPGAPQLLVAGDMRDEWYEGLPEDVQVGLKIGGFHERHPERTGKPGPVYPELEVAERLMDGPWLRDKPTLVGAVTNFEDLGLFDLLYRNGCVGPDEDPWNYHLIDVVTLAAGMLGVRPPWDSKALTRAAGLDPDRYAQHTACGDAAWARDLYNVVMDRRSR